MSVFSLRASGIDTVFYGLFASKHSFPVNWVKAIHVHGNASFTNVRVLVKSFADVQVFMVQTGLPGLRTIQGNHCGMHFGKHFRDSCALFFFVVVFFFCLFVRLFVCLFVCLFLLPCYCGAFIRS